MNCPDSAVLLQFTSDPESLEIGLEEFEEHLTQCANCKDKLEEITKKFPPIELLGLASGLYSNRKDDDFFEDPPHIPGYAIQERSGRGGFGSVYRAQQISTGRQVAIKVSQNLDRAQLRRNKLEANVAAQVDHPHLVRLYDSGAIGFSSYYVFEWVDGNIAERISNSLIPIEQAVEWLMQLAQAVKHLHHLKIIHRDLKPSNVLVTRDDDVKLTDFGIVKDLRDPSATTTNARAIGTPGYMAPEQVGLNETPVGEYTDVYGLGAVLYALLVGHAPFVGGDAQSVMRQVVEKSPHAPSKIRRDVPRDLEVICLKCLEKNVKDRYASVAELAIDLDNFRQGCPITARPLSWIERTWRYSKRQPLVAGLSAAVLCLLCIACTSIIVSRGQANTDRLQHASDAFLGLILESRAEKLEDLYELAQTLDEASLARSISEKLDDPQISDVKKLRLICIDPRSTKVRLDQRELLSAVTHLNADETAVLAPRLSRLPLLRSPSMLEELQNWILDSQATDGQLQLSALNAELGSGTILSPKAASPLLNSLLRRPEIEAESWAQAFRKVDTVLLKEIVEHDSKCEMKTVLENANMLGDSDFTSLKYTNTDVLQAIGWEWAKSNNDLALGIVQVSPVTRLTMVESLEGESRRQLQETVAKQWDMSMIESEKLFDSRIVSPELSEMVSRFGGLVTRNRGFMLAVPKDSTEELLAELKANGFSLRSLQPYQLNGKTLFAAAFEVSSEQCEIDWVIELSEVNAAIERRHRDGFQAKSFWVWPDGYLHEAAVLWRKCDARQSQFFQTNAEVGSAEKELADFDSAEYETELLEQSVYDFERHFRFALRSHTKIAPRDEASRRYAYIAPRYFGGISELSRNRYVEYLPDGNSFLSLPACEPDLHALQCKQLCSYGYQPIDVCVDRETGRITTQWLKDADPSHQRLKRKQLSLALAAWLLGDPEPALQSLQPNRDPTLRTWVTETLGQVDRSTQRFLRALKRPLTPMQYQGLLLAMCNWNAQRFEVDRDSIVDVLKRLWNHDDAAVHFAADLLLRKLKVPDHQNIVRNDLANSHSYENRPPTRNWYYGPLGLPFIVIEPIDLQLLGSDERIPWLMNIDRRLGRLDRKIAVCAIETPQWLMNEFNKDARPDPLELGSPYRHVLDCPAAGYSLPYQLKFCRWLSDKEGHEPEDIALPAIDKIGQSFRFPANYLAKSGYRLPTDLEFEMYCRAGTWTSNHLGESFEFLSNYSWNTSNSESTASPIAMRKPNPLGLFDVLGNLYETALGEEQSTGFADAQEDWHRWNLTADHHVNIRGGSFLSSRIYCSSGANHHIAESARDANAGFRIVRTID